VTVRLRWDDGEVTGDWDRPSSDPRAVLVLAHGAGGDLSDQLLVGVARELAMRDVAVLRFNFPYREAGRKAPGAQTQSEACYRAVASQARVESVPLFCGGKSYGGRMATHIAAEGFPMGGLVLLSYPLHPPGRPERIRDAHLRSIEAPMLFVQGSKDPFATPELLDATIASLDRATFVGIEGGDHSLRVRGRKGAEVVGDVASSIDNFLRANGA
jgi:predicted alpha/beta-hydrolase family hydrolase